MLSRRAPCEEQNRDVAATDHEQQRDGPKEQEHRLLQIAGVRLGKTANADLELLGEDIRRLAVELLVERPEFTLCGAEVDARLQLDLRAISMRLIGCHFHRNVDLSISPCEAHRHHAEDRVGLMVELDGFSDDRGIATVVPLPELEAHYCYGLRILA